MRIFFETRIEEISKEISSFASSDRMLHHPEDDFECELFKLKRSEITRRCWDYYIKITKIDKSDVSTMKVCAVLDWRGLDEDPYCVEMSETKSDEVFTSTKCTIDSIEHMVDKINQIVDLVNLKDLV